MTSRVPNIGGTLQGPAMPHISSFAKLDLPVKRGLVGAYVFGGNMALSLRNRVNPALPLSLVGSPTIAPLFGATLSHDNCFETLLPQTTDHTWIVIARPQQRTGSDTSANRAPLIGNQAVVGGLYRGDQLYFGVGSSYYNQVDRNAATPASSSQSLSAYDPTKWSAIASIVDGNAGLIDGARRQSGVRTFVTPTTSFTNRALYPSRTLRIGSDGAGSPGLHQAPVSVGMFVPHDVALTHAELDQQLDYLSAWLGAILTITDI